MVKDRQVKRLFRLLLSGKTLAQAADKAGMDEKTARKYRELGRLPSEFGSERTWRTRLDPFAEVWPEVHALLQEAPGLEAKTLFTWLKTKYPEKKFDDSQLAHFNVASSVGGPRQARRRKCSSAKSISQAACALRTSRT